MSRWIENCTTEQSARLYHKFDNAQVSDFARAIGAKLNAIETMEKELVDIKAEWSVESRTVETDYGSGRHGCSTDDIMKG